jgi:hypothetical protein
MNQHVSEIFYILPFNLSMPQLYTFGKLSHRLTNDLKLSYNCLKVEKGRVEKGTGYFSSSLSLR